MDGPHRRVRRAPGARLAGLAAVLVLLLAVLVLPSAHTAFSATTGTPPNSLAADRLQPPPSLTAAQTCSPPIGRRGALASTRASPLVLSPPAGTRAGDVLVAQVAYYGTSIIDTPSGWTRILADVSVSGNVVTSAVYWKKAVDDEPAATFTRPSSSNGDMVGGIAAYSGVDTSDPVAVAGGLTGSGDTATSPALTTEATGAVAVHLMARSGVQPATPDPRELWTRSSDSESVTAFDQPLAGPGAVPQRTSTTSGSSTAWIAQTVVLRPAPLQVGASLVWTATPSTWATGYQGERVVGGTVYGPITVPLDTTTFTDTGLANGTTYTYRVWAYRGAWMSDEAVVTLTTSC